MPSQILTGHFAQSSQIFHQRICITRVVPQLEFKMLKIATFTGVNHIRNEKFVGDKKSTTFIIKLSAASFSWSQILELGGGGVGGPVPAIKIWTQPTMSLIPRHTRATSHFLIHLCITVKMSKLVELNWWHKVCTAVWYVSFANSWVT